MRLYLIRHGETDWNRICRCQGREDIPLNEDGIRQGALSGAALRNLGITAVYCSPLKRAVRTAEEIAKATGLSKEAVHELPELIERDLGPFSGKEMADQKAYFALAAGEDVPGMEPFPEVLERMERALVLLSETGQERIAAVSHGAAINVLLAGLSNRAIGTGKTRLYNGGITVIEGNPKQGFRVVHCNLKPEEAAAILQESSE